MQDHSNSKILTNNPFFNSTISKISNETIFFPTPQLYKINCSRENGNATCAFAEDFLSDISQEPNEDNYRIRISVDAQIKVNKSPKYWVNSIVNSSGFGDLEGIENTMCYDKYALVREKCYLNKIIN